ncbi:hypothetical protein DJ030_03840 [bacterium endosymbiont of Escarpia laminata]|nr:MAG: hypothetical protein DJ030_03840 [bacterium endosymbiont of Escarpia laminata]
MTGNPFIPVLSIDYSMRVFQHVARREREVKRSKILMALLESIQKAARKAGEYIQFHGQFIWNLEVTPDFRYAFNRP